MGNKTVIEIDGNSKGAIVAINGVKKELTGLGSYVDGPFKSSLSSIGSALSVTGITAAVGSLGMLIKNSIDSAEALNAMSQRVGISVESLSTLKYAAEISETSLEKMEAGLKKLSVNLYDVASGAGKDAKTAFEMLKISVTDSDGSLRQTDQVLLDLADRFANMKDGTEKSALAIKLFGRSGLEMIPFLNEGKAGIQAMQLEAEKLGLKIGSDFASQADKFNDNIVALKSVSLGMANSVAVSILPVLNDWISISKDLIVQGGALQTAFQGLAIWAKVFGTSMTIIWGELYLVSTAIKNVAGAGYKLITLDFKGAWQGVENTFNGIGDSFNTVAGFIDKLWSKGSTYEDLIKQYGSGGIVIDDTTKKVAKLYDAFGHPIDKDGNFTNNIQHIEALIAAQKQLGFDTTSQISNLPSFDMNGMSFTENNPFDNIKLQAIDFFDVYDERASEMRQNTSEMFGNMGSMAGQFYQASGQKAKQWFAMQKAFNVAQAIMNTYEGATKALAQGGFFGIAMAATVIAAGLANVAMIASQQPGTGASGNAGAGLSAGTNNNITQPVDRGVGDYNKPQSVVNIIIHGNLVDQDKFAREILPSINKAISDGVS